MATEGAGVNPVDTPLSIARHYLVAGLSVFPVKTDGSKTPALSGWRQFAETKPTEAQLTDWFGDPKRHGIGVPGGPASGNLGVLDFERWGLLGRWGAKLEDTFRAILSRCPVVATPGGGGHVYCRLTEPADGKKLARTASGKCLIETRGQQHFVVAPGSPPSCHPSGQSYRLVRDGWLDGGPFDPIPIAAWEHFCLLAAEFNEYRKPAAREVVGETLPIGNTGNRPGDDFNARSSWGDILSPHGWTVFRSTNSTTYWCRPGKSPAGVSASTGFCRGLSGRDLLYVFSTSAAPFEAEASYSRFAAYAFLNHHGDFTKATRALALAGYGGKAVNP